MFSHIDALEFRLSNERQRLSRATKAQEITLRTIWCKQIEKEIEDEYKRQGIFPSVVSDMSDDDLLSALS
jgi:hypothetical protein